MNTIATTIFALAILHTFLAGRIGAAAHGRPLLRFLGEVEVVFGLWAVPLIAAMTVVQGWDATDRYLTESVSYVEPLFVVVIMALTSTRPIVNLAETLLRRIAGLGGGTPGAWWLTILIVGPLLGSFITEPGAMTLSALLLARQFFDLSPSRRLAYATLGVLFVNVSIGGTLTPFAAPPVLMVARPWDWDLAFMMREFGARVLIALPLTTLAYFLIFRREFNSLAMRRSPVDVDMPAEDAAASGGLLPIPAWITAAHVLFMVWTVVNAHYPVLFLGGFLLFLGFARATAAYQSRIELKTPLLVGFFLAGLVVHGGMQGWWIGPLLGRLGEEPLFAVATVLTAFNDNALITYLATLVPDLSLALKIAVVQGAVAGGGLTVIANAPNPAGQALLSRFFDDDVRPLGLLAGAAVPTLLVIAVFRLL